MSPIGAPSCRMLCVVLCQYVLISLTYAGPFHGFEVVSVTPRHDKDIQLLGELEGKYPSIEFWSRPWRGENTTVLVPDHVVQGFSHILGHVGMSLTVISEDVYRQVTASFKRTPSHVVRKRSADSGRVIDHYNYHDYDEMMSYLQTLAQEYPKNVDLSTLPRTTFENRTMPVVKLSSPDSGFAKKIILVESGVHAREWISPATALYLMETILKDHRQGKADKMMLETFDWHFLPLGNPDGYAYTHTSEQNRLWRKNRNPQTESCIGVDLNRNFDVGRNTASYRARQCPSPIYQGTHAFSEAETKNIRDLVRKHKGDIVAFISLHAKGQYLMTPWAYTAVKPNNTAELNRVGQIMCTGLRERHETNYRFGSVEDLLHYSASGTSLDWVERQIPGTYSYGFELRPTRDDPSAYMLPASQIIPTGQEVLVSLRLMAQTIVYDKS